MMRRAMIGLAAAGTVWALVVSGCGDEVDATTTASGGNGGATSTSATGGTSTTATTAATGGTGGTGGVGGTGGATGTPCEQACDKADMCITAGACQFAGIDCNSDAYDCHGQCIVDADCAAIQTLTQGLSNAEPVLAACLQACGGLNDCFSCTADNCDMELDACQGVPTCEAYLQCLGTCPDGDTMCIQQCAVDNDSAETQAIVTCANANCSTECGTAP